MFGGTEKEQNERATRRNMRTTFIRLYHQGLYGQWLGRLSGQPRTLLNLADMKMQQPVRTRMHGGVKLVSLDRIRGSEGRCNDFDAKFRPLKEFSQERWVSVACAQLGDVTLPLVELVQVNDIYYVRDGHHRISVARWLGQQEIEAEVMVWRSHDLGVQSESQNSALPITSRLPQQVKELSNRVRKTGERLLMAVLQKVQPRVGHTLAQGS